MRKIDIDGILKCASDKIGAQDILIIAMQQYYTSRKHVRGILWALPQNFYRIDKRLLYMFVNASKKNCFLVF